VVQARPGDTITWENRDLVAHNVTADAAHVHSGDLAPGKSWRYTVQPGGSFGYACTLHPTMTGRVELEGAGPPARAHPRDPPLKMK
jgi:plastocyanin